MWAKFKAWFTNLWNKHGSSILFSAGGVAGAWQTVIVSGFVQAGQAERRIIAAIILWAAAHGISRSVTAPPKTPTDAPTK